MSVWALAESAAPIIAVGSGIIVAVLHELKTRALKRRIKYLETSIADDVNTLRQHRALQTLPLALGDASMSVFVIDRVPNEEDKINVGTPVIWMNPRLQRSWRWNDADEIWEESTTIGRNGVNQLSVFTLDNFFHASTVYHEGSRSLLAAVNAADYTTPRGQQSLQAAIAALHPEICAGMDAQAGDTVWTQIRDGFMRGETMNVDMNQRPVTGAVQRVAAPTRDNPFEDHRRPVIIEDDPLDNETPPR